MLHPSMGGSGEQLAALVGNLPVGVFRSTSSGKLEMVNSALAEMLGYRSCEELLAIDDTRQLYADPAERDRIRSQYDPAGRIAAVRLMLRRQDGSLIPVRCHARVVTDARGEPIAYEGVIVDLSETERTDLALVELERRRITEQLMLTEQLASLGSLAAGLAHEINNPLTYVMANLDFAITQLERGTSTPIELQAALVESREGADRVRRIVNSLKGLTQGEDVRAPRDLHIVLESALTLIYGLLRDRVELVRDLGPIPMVEINEPRLTQALLALLLNAIDALPPGRPENRITLATRASSEGWAVLEVQDNGQGISLDVQRRMFDPFFSTKSVGTGTGLGLSICHAIIAHHGGRIEVESEIGVGSTFRILLPA